MAAILAGMSMEGIERNFLAADHGTGNLGESTANQEN